VHCVVHHKLRRNRLDLLRPGRAEEERLALLRQQIHNLLDLRLEAHIEHAVCLVEDEVADLADADLLSAEEVV
jgi:hypothetical protein